MAINPQQYRLKWNGFHLNLSEVFEKMLIHENLVDCTVACDGASIKTHKLVLSAASPYFQSLFLSNPCKHPIVILKDVRFEDLKSIIDFIYKGEVNVPQHQLTSLLKTAETLKIRGLTEVGDKQNMSESSLQSIPLRHRKRKRKPNKLSNLQNNESNDSSEEENRNLLNDNRFGNNSYNYSINFRSKNIPQKTNESNESIEKQRDNQTLDDIEPIKLLEQSMSTSENYDYSNEGIVVTPDVHLEIDDQQSNDNQQIPINNEKYYQSFQYNESSFDSISQMTQNNNQSTPQTIEEYERLLAEIQRKKLTTCPICSKVFLKKSKLIRHYHTHFSSFRPKFSCISCGKLFTTHDWCKRHQMSCNQKTSTQIKVKDEISPQNDSNLIEEENQTQIVISNYV